MKAICWNCNKVMGWLKEPTKGLIIFWCEGCKSKFVMDQNEES